MIYQEEIKDRFCQIMKQSNYESFFKGKQLIQKILHQRPFLTQSFIKPIIENFSVIKNLLIMLYLFSLNIQPPRSLTTFKSDRYLSKFNQLKPDCYPQLITWMQKLQKQQGQAVVLFLIEQLPKFLIKKKDGIIDPIDLEFLLSIFNEIEINSPHSAKICFDFITKLQKMKIQSEDSKQNLIIKTVINILASPKKGKGSMSIILDQYLLGLSEDQNIDKFCLTEGIFIYQLEINAILKIFSELFKKGINSYILDFITKISHILVQNQEFYKLKTLYAQFILPILARRGKYCLKERVEESVLKLCQFYVIGFADHCRIGLCGAYYLLQGIEHVTSDKYRKRWAKLCFFAMKNQKSQISSIEKCLKEKDFDQKSISQCKQYKMNQNSVWQITTRNIRQHKVYKKIPSNLKGIHNKRLQCYIISVVQALFHTKRIIPLLRKIHSKKQSVANLIQVLQKLQQKQMYIRVNRLQQNGPQFARNQYQQDAQQYLLALINELEENFIKQNLLKEFKQIFQISSNSLVKCNNCNYEATSNQIAYMHTICYKQPIRMETTEDLTDFVCLYCKKRNCTKKTNLFVNCQIFIVHINRFSNIWGEMKKQLPTQKILRKIGSYELVGMIFHIGKSVQSGHYTYYCRIQKKKWAELNDERTSQFYLDNENQEFERQFKAQVTPYILFYQKV